MYKSLIYKELIKTRSAIGVIAAVFLGIGIYSFMKISENIRLLGIVNAWENIIQKDSTLFPHFECLPLVAGIVLAVSQYVPELQFKRLKLTLHLPLNENRIMLTMLLYGVSVVLLLLIITMPLLLTGLSRTFPAEIVCSAFRQLTPWFLAGPAAYLLTAWICLEPLWKQKMLNAVSGIIALSFFLLPAVSGAYRPFIPCLIFFVVAAFFFAFYSAARFKEGVQ
jgi:hypothetical protein